MRFISELGRACRLRKVGHEYSYIATRLNRSVEEIRVVLK